MARHPDWNLVRTYRDYAEKYPDLNKSQIARLMGKDVRQIRRIANKYLSDSYPQKLVDV